MQIFYLFGFVAYSENIEPIGDAFIIAEFISNILSLVQFDLVAPGFGADFDSGLNSIRDANQKNEH